MKRWILMMCLMVLSAAPAQALEIEDTTAYKLLERVKASPAKVVLINAWATWCPPCVEEFPGLVQVMREYENKGVEVYFVSMDAPAKKVKPKVRQFVSRYKLEKNVFIKTQRDNDFINGLNPTWRGAIPATFVYRNGERVHFHLGFATAQQFRAMIEEALHEA